MLYFKTLISLKFLLANQTAFFAYFQMKWKKLIILGDSITQSAWSRECGWVSDMANLLQRKCDVMNRGMYGYNTENVRIIMPKIFDEFNDASNICGVVILLGSNDSADSSSKPLHVPLERFEQNYNQIVEFLLKLGVDCQKIVLISPPKKDDASWEITSRRLYDEPSDQFDYLVPAYVKVVKEIATQNNTIFIDFYEIMLGKGEGYRELLSDGLHLSEKGSQLLFENLAPLVSKLASEVKQNFPDYTDLQESQTEIDQ